ncbi:hypothetical protein ACT1U9_32905 (plasmid) [Streptomyces sp. BR1]|uniref:hypothetical protein n=1 Tax=Streptomyces sp. BR1 TaxID=1592323 RepID=UPI00402B0699
MISSYVIHVWDSQENIVDQHSVSADGLPDARARLDEIARQYTRGYELTLAHPMGGSEIARRHGEAS